MVKQISLTNSAMPYVKKLKDNHIKLGVQIHYINEATIIDCGIHTKGSIDGSPETCSAGTECYNLDVAGTEGGSSLGTITIAGEYDGNGTTTAGTLSTTYQEIMSSDGAALNDTLTLTVLSAITALNQAATDYSDNLEVVGAGNF